MIDPDGDGSADKLSLKFDQAIAITNVLITKEKRR